MLSARVAVLVSGGGTNLQALLDAQDSGVLRSGAIVLVVSSRRDAPALERARSRGVRAEAVEGETAAAFEARLLELLEEERVAVVVLAGFLRILSGEFVARYAGRILNVHPSLIPSFCGPGFYGLRVHRAALDAGVTVTGATVHLVDETPDGGPILMQQAVAVLPDDTPETLQRRVMEQAEWRLLPEAVERICQNRGTPSPAPPGRGTCPPAPPLTFPTGGQRPPVGKVEGVPRGLALSAGFGAEPQGFGSSPAALLGGNRYPGRGIILGCAPDGRAVLAYFIMGRSASSRGRAFERAGDDLVIRLLNPERVADPSLILYAPIRVCGAQVVVTNGDQTETIREALRDGGGFESALRTRTYEPDAPHHTPRVSGLLSFEGTEFSYRLSILKAGEAGRCLRQFFEYEAAPGTGHLIHTYARDGDPLPSFAGEPRAVRVPSDIDAFSRELWDALDAENRVALCVRYLSADGSGFEEHRFGRHGKGEGER